jgi:hypothetical protein
MGDELATINSLKNINSLQKNPETLVNDGKRLISQAGMSRVKLQAILRTMKNLKLTASADCSVGEQPSGFKYRLLILGSTNTVPW